MLWRVEEIPELQVLLKAVLDITSAEFEQYVMRGDADGHRNAVKRNTTGLTADEIEEVCNVLTKVGGEVDGAY